MVTKRIDFETRRVSVERVSQDELKMWRWTYCFDGRKFSLNNLVFFERRHRKNEFDRIESVCGRDAPPVPGDVSQQAKILMIGLFL